MAHIPATSELIVKGQRRSTGHLVARDRGAWEIRRTGSPGRIEPPRGLDRTGPGAPWSEIAWMEPITSTMCAIRTENRSLTVYHP